jgi:peptidoglycan/LPS O-acetylase OafA/YrhL
MNSESNKYRIDYLDGIRGLAILLVIIGHGSKAINDTSFYKPLFYFIGNEYLGVEIFFVLSGFLITKLLLNEYNKYGQIDIKKFYIKRILRIFPVLYLYIGVIYLLKVLGVIIIKSGIFAIAIFYLFNYRPLFQIDYSSGEWYLMHLWSLSMEEQFYLLWPFLILVFSFNRMTKVVIILLLLFPFFRLANYIFLPECRGLMNYMFHTAGDCILYGCLGALLLNYHMEYVKRFFKIIDTFKLPIIFVGYLFFLVPMLHHYWLPTKSGFITHILDPFCIICLIVWLIESDKKCWLLFNNKYIMMLGVYSYSIYIWQQLFLTPANINTTILGVFPINYLATFILAALSYNFVEKQFLKLKNSI